MKKVLYIDMDNTLVDFQSGLERVSPEVLARYEGDEDEIPGVFALMDPMPGAIESFRDLGELFDTYILSTAPWGNPTAWHDKLEWVQRHLGKEDGTPAHKRLILSHHKNLNVGDFLVDDRPTHRGADKFSGEVLHFGAKGEYKTWPEVVAYLKERA